VHRASTDTRNETPCPSCTTGKIQTLVEENKSYFPQRPVTVTDSRYKGKVNLKRKYKKGREGKLVEKEENKKKKEENINIRCDCSYLVLLT
jgi:hypothetical protein